MTQSTPAPADEPFHSSLSDEESPLGLARDVEQLMRLPQSLCKQRGNCCRVATFKDLKKQDEIEALGQQDDILGEMARDFASVFVPYSTSSEAAAVAPEFVDRVLTRGAEKGLAPEQVGLFHCRYVQADGRCGVHEDRPTGCRTYPFPHEKTLFHPGCGYEKQAQENWQKIKHILETLGLSSQLQ